MSFCGIRQGKSYCKMRKIAFSLFPSAMSFRFVNTTYKRVRILLVRIPPSTFVQIQFLIKIVDLEVPMLFGLPYLRTHNLLINYLDNFLVNKTYNWEIPIEYEKCHLFSNSIIYTAYFTRP